MNAKTLLISRDYFPPQVGGISSMMACLAAEFGPTRICCLTGYRGPKYYRTAQGDIRVYRRPSVFHWPNSLQALAIAETFAEIAAVHGPRTVQLATCSDGYLGMWGKKVLGLPFVVYAHGNEILALRESTWKRPTEALCAASSVFANSRYTAELVQDLGVDRHRIRILHPGCDIQTFQPRPPSAELRERLLGNRLARPLLLTVGNLVERKGHDMVIRTVAELAQHLPDLRYLIVGVGPAKQYLETLAAELRVQDRVIFVGRVADQQLPNYYALCDVFVMPSRLRDTAHDVEGFGLVFLEANACGKPVVAGRSGGIPDAVVDGETGYLVNPESAPEIAAAIWSLTRDPAAAADMGECGRRRVVEGFTWRHAYIRVVAALDEALREPSATH
jgi:phosphatidylinositol alpha-1,6-mannosyltransferase